MNSRIGILIGILIISIVLISGWFLSSRVSEKPEENAVITGTVNGSRLSINTDKEMYGVGDEIVITITNDLSRPILYYDVCSLRLCHYLEHDWFCEVTECQGSTMVIEPGSSKEMYDRARNPAATRLRYEFDYQIASEDTLYIARSEEFAIGSDVNAVPADVREPSPSSDKTETVVTYPNKTEWTNSDDGVLSLRLSSDKEEYVLGESIEIKIELRNNSKSTVRAAALAYALGTYGNTLTVAGPGQIEYNGPYKEFYAPPIEIFSGEIRQETTVLSLDNWKGLDVKGDYTVSCTYHSSHADYDEGLWSGTIRSGTIQFRMRKR